MNDSWTIIVLTGTNELTIKEVEFVVKALQRKECIPLTTEILAVQDPSENIGSGAATLNAIYVATEYLSALNDLATFNTDVLRKSKILLIHCGRGNIFDSGNLKALISLPVANKPVCEKEKKYGAELVTNIEHLIHVATELNRNTETNLLNCGVWVCSTDMSFKIDGPITRNSKINYKYPTIFCVQTNADYASRHGTVCVNENGFVENIIYCGSPETVKLYEDKTSLINIVSGMVYLPVNVTEDMLVFHSITPLNRCTYMGLDSGGEPLQISLFFDILIAMALKVSKEDFISGNCGKLYELKLNQNQRDAIIRARTTVWNRLSKYDLQAKVLDKYQHIYWNDRLNARNQVDNLIKLSDKIVNCSYVDEKAFQNKNVSIINSYIKATQGISIGSNTAICHSLIQSYEIKIGTNCYLCGVSIETEGSLSIPDGTVLIGFQMMNHKERNYVALGIDDNPQNLLSELKSDSLIQILMKENGIVDCEGALETSSIFPTQIPIEIWMEFCRTKKLIASGDKLLSLSEITENISLEKEQEWRMIVRKKICCSLMRDGIIEQTNLSLMNYFKAATAEGWANLILETLEDVAFLVHEDNFKLCLTLSSIADLLGTMAGNLGKIRSGPGNNKLWEDSFAYLKNNDITKGLEALKIQREKWMSRNDLLVRAARHYERALQILIQNAVMSATEFITLTPTIMPAIGEWVLVECPARADLLGGWTDTPPICYEQGGSVVNVAILIDGKKPIGAKVRRIEEYKLVFHMISNQGHIPEVFDISNINEMLDYNVPSAPGSLLKAAFIAAGVISISGNCSLEQQLEKYQGGFDIHIWSNLPQGSGLGTSSILASAVISALWTATGQHYTKKSLLHAVLYLEQLMTTGGGWQDQVGGVIGGFKRGFSLPQLPLKIEVENIYISNENLALFNDHLLLVYTGKVRLAKNLLQNVIRNWYARESQIVQCFQELFDHSMKMASALVSGDLSRIGEELNIYWDLKKILAPGCDPLIVQQLMDILRPEVWGQLLLGAGGGGFMCVLSKTPKATQKIATLIKQANLSETVSVHSVEIDLDGMVVYSGNKKLQID